MREHEIATHLNTAQIVLLLISADFFASGYCDSIEMKRALERHDRGELRVIPIMLRPIDDWKGAPFGHLQALPAGAKPVTGRTWKNQDEAFANIAQGLRKVVEELRSQSSGSSQEENDANTSPYSDKHTVKSDGPVQGQVIGDHANVHIYLNGGQNKPEPSRQSSSDGNNRHYQSSNVLLPELTPRDLVPNFLYDVVLSFAGEDRDYAKALADALLSRDIRVFYDEYEQPVVRWGKNLYTYLSNRYRKDARYCVMLLSKHYARKLWTTHEREAAQARALYEHEEYILPVRLDSTEIPGILPTIAYLNWPPETAETITLIEPESPCFQAWG